MFYIIFMVFRAVDWLLGQQAVLDKFRKRNH